MQQYKNQYVQVEGNADFVVLMDAKDASKWGHRVNYQVGFALMLGLS